MINANELRLGNIVQDEISGELMIVVEIGENVGASVINRDKFPLPDGWVMAPIALTSEWPERMGFIKDRNGWHMHGTQFSLTEKLYPCWLDRMLWPQDIEAFRQSSLSYVHQLQNIYFALTGEELKIKS